MKCGTVAVVGRANAGKSTLVNVLVGEKVAIVSPKPQTTRERIYGVITEPDYQIVFEDTPGIYKSSTLLNSRMQKAWSTTAMDTDVILFVVDGHAGIKDEDLDNCRKFATGQVPLIIVFTKIDIMPKEKIPEVLSRLSEIENVDDIVPVSARRGKNLDELMKVIKKHLKETDGYIYDPDAVTDKSYKYMVGELMREKILLKYDREIPHGIAVIVHTFEKMPSGTYNIGLDIICEKQNHKAILIGKQGAKLKEVNSFARQDMEKLLGAKVFLEVFVKVKEGWRDNRNLLNEYGYSDLNMGNE